MRLILGLHARALEATWWRLGLPTTTERLSMSAGHLTFHAVPGQQRPKNRGACWVMMLLTASRQAASPIAVMNLGSGENCGRAGDSARTGTTCYSTTLPRQSAPAYSRLW